MNYLYGFLIAYFIVRFITPFLIKFAVKIDFLDKPTERKNHEKPMPLIGGTGIFIGFFCGYFVFFTYIKIHWSIIIGSLLIYVIGIIDDWHKTRGKEFAILPRLIIQIFSAIIIYSSGIVFNGFTNPFTHMYIKLPSIMSFILTITWVFGVTTVINWSDGMDGLAGSLSAIAASTLFVVALAKNQPSSAMMSILLVGALLGFLKYNRYPAQTFIGDSGANFSGFILSIIALDGAFKQATLLSIFIPILALGVPIFDNIYVVIKRMLKGTPIYTADASQIHHRLLLKGLNPKQVLMFISLLSVCFSLFSLIILLLKV